MKKITLSLAAVSFFALSLVSCGEKYTPLTEEQKAKKAETIFNETSADLKAKKEAACAEGFEAAVAAKVAELSAEATASN